VGVKDVGVMIGLLVWEGREDNLLKDFGITQRILLDWEWGGKEKKIDQVL
jgi:hypothetical protein